MTYDIKFKNFSIFKDETKIKFSPINFLIGANGSGKSSVLKILNIIERNFEISNVNKFDLGNIDYQINNKRKPLEITVQIDKNVFRKYKITIHKLDPNHSLEDSYVSKNELNLVYLDLDNKLILETRPTLNDNSTHGIKVFLDYNRLINIIENEEIRNKLKLFQPIKNKIETTLLHPNFIDPRFFESWFWSEGFTLLLRNLIDEKENNFHNKKISSELITHISKLFKTKEHTELNTNNRNASEEIKLLDLELIRWNDLGLGKRVFTPEDSFGKTLLNMDYAMEPGSIYDTREFLSKWTKEFFGSEAKFEFKKIDKEFNYYVAKLANHFLTEQSTGNYRILHLICKLALMTYSSSWVNFLQKKDAFFVQKKFLVFEEPESNLHPDFQIKLAEMIFDFSKLTDRYLIIETHSEYMIRTMQYLVAKNGSSTDSVGILNFGQEGKVKSIKINPNGSLSDNFFSGFFTYSELLRLKLDALNYERNN
jgi:predicted ATPase